MTGDLLLTLLGLFLLLAGGELLVRGAASLAQRLGVSPLVVGLTVVAFGTSAPELFVNATAAWQGNPGISFGNIFGSNMANIGLIVAAAAMIRPLDIRTVVIRRELPMMLLATGVACVLGMDFRFSGRTSAFDRGDSFVLLALFSVFVYYTIQDVLRGWREEAAAPDAMPDAAPETLSLPASVGLTIAGIIALVLGGRFTVDGAISLAEALGVSQTLIGLTLVAVGTSLPELAATVVAALRGHADLAVGNVVGSNIFNLLLVLGTTAMISPVTVPDRGGEDMAAVVLLSLLLWMTSASAGQRIIRAEALILLVVYVLHMTQRSFF